MLIYVCRVSETLPFLGKLPLGDIGLLALAALLLFGPRHLLAGFFDTPLTKRVVLFVALIVLSATYSIWPVKSIQFISTSMLLTMVLYVGLVMLTRSIADFRWFCWILMIGAILFSVNGLISGDWSQRVEVRSAFDQNDLALFLVTILPLALAESALARRTFVRYALLVAVLSMMLLTILTGSRGGFLGLATVGLYVLLFPGFILTRKPASMGTRIGRVVAIAILFIPVFMLAPESTRERLMGITDVSNDYNVVSPNEGRIAIWTRGMKYLARHPWGSGVASFQSVDSIMGGQYRTAHNSFVQVSVETGVVGGIVFIGIFVSAIGRLRRTVARLRERELVSYGAHHAYGHALIAAILGYAVACFFLSQGYSPLLFSLFALAGCLLRLSDAALEAQTAQAEVQPRNKQNRPGNLGSTK